MRISAIGFLLLSVLPVFARAHSRGVPVPDELRSQRFTVSLDGQPAGVVHAAATYHFVSFEFRGTTNILVGANSDDYWASGVQVQPWRWGIRPEVEGRNIKFTIKEPGKFSVSRPGSHGAGAEMLFIFANSPETNVPEPAQAGVRYFGPGIHRGSIDAHSGDRIYLAPDAFILGSLNVWGVSDVRVWGRGTIVYDGPQNPAADEGWMHKPNWHGIVMDHASDIQISGIAVVVRSRTWMIQLLSSRHLLFENVKVIGGCPGNANQDGIDWLGGGDTVIRDCFFRASDDIFALYGNWLGYSPAALTTPGEDVTNILIEKCVLSTSISNIVRVSWPQKIFNSRNFTLRDCDVIQMGQGGCKIPFALLEIWDDPGGHGEHSGYTFEDIRLEEWYSLLQLRQAQPAIRDVVFRRIWTMGSPQLVPNVTQGDVSGVETSDSNLASVGQSFTYSRVPAPNSDEKGTALQFHAIADAASYHWNFGDGATAEGRDVSHVIADTAGTERDGSGRFRVVLKTIGADRMTRWDAKSVFAATDYQPAGIGSFVVQETGGYTFYVVANDPAKITLDGQVLVESPDAKPQVCGMAGNMAQLAVKSIGLMAGAHSLDIKRTHGEGDDNFALYWEGPNRSLTRIEVAKPVDPASKNTK